MTESSCSADHARCDPGFAAEADFPITSLTLPSVAAFLRKELNISRLDEMVPRHLWLAGRRGNIRPLHRQLMLGRRILVAEQLDLHLLWRDDVIFIKPLPAWILDEGFVSEHISRIEELSQAANGFFASFAKLIVHKSDFQIAQHHHLLPESLSWEGWKTIVAKDCADLASNPPVGRGTCSPRFIYGELRLWRVNALYRLHPAYGFRNLVRGYFHEDTTYQSFFRRHFAWLVTVFLYCTLILTAMQVGLQTTQLASSAAFNKASHAFAIFSTLVPTVAVAIDAFVTLFLTVYHFRATLRQSSQI